MFDISYPQRPCYILFVLFYFVLNLHVLKAQEPPLRWRNPENNSFAVVEGQAWPEEVEDPYDRLPLRAKNKVREAVWNLSKHNAGLMIRFRCNSSQITVRYQVAQGLNMPHMPSTGVSGMDLYSLDSDGKSAWCRGSWEFKDTIRYRFQGLKPSGPYHNYGYEYRLYLPLYNQVQWMEIGVPDTATFTFLPTRLEKPIVVYGTSIAQGGCASRPGMAWTTLLQRAIDRPLINLAFSGNGRLEKELVELMTEIEAKLYVLDNLPNLVSQEMVPDTELVKRIREAVALLRNSRKETPILLVEHAGYTDGEMMPDRRESYERVNRIMHATYQDLIREGYTGLFYLSKDELHLEMDDMVDGTHPNDLGMSHYAEAYEKKIREILMEPTGGMITTKPVPQYREPQNYDWEERHRTILKLSESTPVKAVVFANSIVHFWGGEPKSPIVVEEDSWRDFFTPLAVFNFAYGWDRIENILWRIYHDELDRIQPDKIMIMAGTNNLHLNSDEEIIKGLDAILNAIRERKPKTKIYLLGILPRRNYESRIFILNGKIAQLAGKRQVNYRYAGDPFAREGKVIEGLFSDGLHPNADGYLKLREEFLKILRE